MVAPKSVNEVDAGEEDMNGLLRGCGVFGAARPRVPLPSPSLAARALFSWCRRLQSSRWALMLLCLVHLPQFGHVNSGRVALFLFAEEAGNSR